MVYIEGEKYHAKPSDIFFIQPGQLHSSIDDEDNNYELIEVKFTIDNNIHRNLIPRIPCIIHIHDTAAILIALDRVVEARLIENSEESWLARVRLIETLMLLVKEANPVSSSRSISTHIDKKIVQAANYMTLNYAKPITVKKMANIVNLSNSHFASCFKRIMRTSPMEFLFQRRFQRAKELLEQSSMSITRISEICRFDSSQYFARFFAQRENISPSKYRQRLFQS